MSPMSPLTLTVATVATGAVAYAVYFDYMRRNSPTFRKGIRRNERRKARGEKEEAAAAVQAQRQKIKDVVVAALQQGFPSSVAERETYFMDQVSMGETLGNDPSRAMEAALSFYRGLKVYPSPADLIPIYDQTVPKHVLNILAEMIALDPSIAVGGSRVGGAAPSAANASEAAGEAASAREAAKDDLDELENEGVEVTATDAQSTDNEGEEEEDEKEEGEKTEDDAAEAQDDIPVVGLD